MTESITFALTLVNPCIISSLALNASPFPEKSTYVLRDVRHELEWISTTNLVRNLDTSANCGTLSVQFYHSTLGDLDDVFTVEFGDSMFTVPYTEDTEKADSYKIHYRVYYDDYSDVFIDTSTPFEIIIDDPCDPPAVLETNLPLVNQEYTVATPS